MSNKNDNERATEYFERACHLDSADGCMMIAIAHETGVGAAKDEALALTLYHRLCADRLGRTCTAEATLYLLGRGVAVDLEKGMVLLKEGCSSGDRIGCRMAKHPLIRQDVGAATRSAIADESRCRRERGRGDDCD